MSNPLELGVQAVVSHLVWMQGTELESSARVVAALPSASPPAPGRVFLQREQQGHVDEQCGLPEGVEPGPRRAAGAKAGHTQADPLSDGRALKWKLTRNISQS